jgi:serine/threonine-protein kinase BUR1
LQNHILHRDMKAANLLISNTGALLIADFGLARAFDAGDNPNRGGKERKYTNCVVTRWYRPPELLLGARQYGGEVDMWGIGCVLGEMFMRRPILPGTSDLDQLEKIWLLCGAPNQHSWPNFDSLPGCEGVKRFANHPRKLKASYEQCVFCVSFFFNAAERGAASGRRRAISWIGCSRATPASASARRRRSTTTISGQTPCPPTPRREWRFLCS